MHHLRHSLVWKHIQKICVFSKKYTIGLPLSYFGEKNCAFLVFFYIYTHTHFGQMGSISGLRKEQLFFLMFTWRESNSVCRVSLVTHTCILQSKSFGTKMLSFKSFYFTESSISAPIDRLILPAEAHFKICTTHLHYHYIYNIWKQCAPLDRDHASTFTANMERNYLVWIYWLLYFNSRDMNASIHTSPPSLWVKNVMLHKDQLL